MCATGIHRVKAILAYVIVMAAAAAVPAMGQTSYDKQIYFDSTAQRKRRRGRQDLWRSQRRYVLQSIGHQSRQRHQDLYRG